MPNELKRAQGKSLIAGSTVYTVPVDGIVTLIGLRCTNTTAGEEKLAVTINSTNICSPDTRLPVGSAFDPVAGQKILAEAGDTINVFSLADNALDVHMSFLLQTPDAP